MVGGVVANVTLTNGNGHRFLEFCDRYELSIENSRWHNKAQTTWVSATGFTKRIDYIACDKFVRTRSLNWRTRRGSSLWFTTDHYLLEWQLRLPGSIRKLKVSLKRGLAKPKPKISALCDDESVRTKYVECLDEEFKDDPKGDVEALNESILAGLRSSVAAACPVSVPEKTHKPWLNDELSRLIQSQRGLTGSRLKGRRKEIRRLQNKLQNEYYDEKSRSISHAAEQKEVAREFKEIKKFDKMHSGRGKLMISNEKLRTHFEAHFSEQPDFQMPEELENPEQQDYFNQSRK